MLLKKLPSRFMILIEKFNSLLKSLFIIATESIANIHNLIVFGQPLWIIQGLHVIHYIRPAIELMERYKLVIERHRGHF